MAYAPAAGVNPADTPEAKMPDSEDEIRRLLQAAKLDQGEAGAQQMGRLAGALYTAMLAGGLPVRLAGTLTRDWFYLQLRPASATQGIIPQSFWDSGHSFEEGETEE